MDTDLHTPPTEDDCWAQFREAMAGVMADMLQQGWQPELRSAAS